VRDPEFGGSWRKWHGSLDPGVLLVLQSFKGTSLEVRGREKKDERTPIKFNFNLN
jgi:hypothetical protein